MNKPCFEAFKFLVGSCVWTMRATKKKNKKTKQKTAKKKNDVIELYLLTYTIIVVVFRIGGVERIVFHEVIVVVQPLAGSFVVVGA